MIPKSYGNHGAAQLIRVTCTFMKDDYQLETGGDYLDLWLNVDEQHQQKPDGD